MTTLAYIIYIVREMKRRSTMEYYELTLTVQLSEDLDYTFANDKIGQEINKAMLKDSDLIELQG